MILLGTLLALPFLIQGRLNEPKDPDQQQGHRQLWHKGADVFILIDGGDSIHPDDFAAQKDGVIAAISSTNVVPRDGSVAIGVIQYGGPKPELAVPMTKVTSDDATINLIVNGVATMNQLGGTANMGAAVNFAAASVVPRRKARQVFLLTTDEILNSGPSLTDAVKEAKRSSWKLDVFSVLAFGTTYTDAQYHAAYDPLLFDGQLVFARTVSEFAQWIAVAGFGYPSNGAGIGEVPPTAFPPNTPVAPVLSFQTPATPVLVPAYNYPPIMSMGVAGV